MALGNAFPVRSSIPDTFRVLGVWTGGGAAANMTKATGDWNRGIASVNYNAATGKYLITFADVGQQIVAYNISCTSTTGVIPKDVALLRATLSQSAKTVEIEIRTPATDVAAAALVDLVSTFKILIDVTFAKNAPDA